MDLSMEPRGNEWVFAFSRVFNLNEKGPRVAAYERLARHWPWLFELLVMHGLDKDPKVMIQFKESLQRTAAELNADIGDECKYYANKEKAEFNKKSCMKAFFKTNTVQNIDNRWAKKSYGTILHSHSESSSDDNNNEEGSTDPEGFEAD